MNLPGQPTSSETAKIRKIIDHTQLHQIAERLFARFPIHIVENNQKNAARAWLFASASRNFAPASTWTVTHLAAGEGRSLDDA